MSSKYLWLFPVFISVYLLYSHDYLSKIKLDDFMQKGINIIGNIYFTSDRNPNSISETNADQKIFTQNELRKYTNLKDGLYISILGQVFDVTKAATRYGPGATYHVFTGRDASLAYITGDFNDKGLTDDVSSLSLQEINILNKWVKFYNDNYICKGKLSGRHYHEDGSPTEETNNIQKMLKQAIEINLKEEDRKRMFPPCNMERSIDSGNVVWCTEKSGGIARDWIGVPRMLFESAGSKESRCVCVKLDSKEYEEVKGRLREYVGCDEHSTECSVIIDDTEQNVALPMMQ